MWWAWRKRGIVFVDRGIVGTLPAGHGVVHVSVCDDGGEFELLAGALAEAQAASWQLLMGPSLVEWTVLDRITNIWRHREREIAARAILSPDSHGPLLGQSARAIYVADPAPKSRWVCYMAPTDTMVAAERVAGDRKHRWLSMESLCAVTASGVEHTTESAHVIAMICARNVAWIVKDRHCVLDCGVWGGTAMLETVAADCRRLQITYGIPSDRVLLLKLRSNLEGAPFVETVGEWNWINRKLTSLFTVVSVEIGNEDRR